eukprot:3571935-Rhodomonas_salina.1
MASACMRAGMAAVLISSSVHHRPQCGDPSVAAENRSATRCVTRRVLHRLAPYTSSITSGSLSSRWRVG